MSHKKGQNNIFGAVKNEGKQLKITGNFSLDGNRKNKTSRLNYGIPKNRLDEKYAEIKNLDTKILPALIPVTRPLTLSLCIESQQDREEIRNSLMEWGLTSDYCSVFSETLPIIVLRFRHIGAMMAVLKMGNKHITPTDPLYEFKSAKILLGKTLMSKKERFESGRFGMESRVVCERSLTYNRALDLEPALTAINNYNINMSKFLYDREKPTEYQVGYNEPEDPESSVAFSIERNFLGGADKLSNWLHCLITSDIYISQNRNDWEKYENARRKAKDRELPGNVVGLLGKSNITSTTQFGDQTVNHFNELAALNETGPNLSVQECPSGNLSQASVMPSFREPNESSTPTKKPKTGIIPVQAGPTRKLVTEPKSIALIDLKTELAKPPQPPQPLPIPVLEKSANTDLGPVMAPTHNLNRQVGAKSKRDISDAEKSINEEKTPRKILKVKQSRKLQNLHMQSMLQADLSTPKKTERADTPAISRTNNIELKRDRLIEKIDTMGDNTVIEVSEQSQKELSMHLETVIAQAEQKIQDMEQNIVDQVSLTVEKNSDI